MAVLIQVDSSEDPETLKATADFLHVLAGLSTADEKEPAAPPSPGPANRRVVGEVLFPNSKVLDGMRATSAAGTSDEPTPETAFAPPAFIEPVEADIGGYHTGGPFPGYTPPTTGVELDSAGLPWDGRIHSETKTQVKDGTWRQKRNTDPALVEAVTAELRAAMNAPAQAPAASVPTPPPFVASAAPSALPEATIPVTESAGAAPTASPSDGTVVVPPTREPINFPQLMKGITMAKIDPARVVAACAAVGIPSIPALAQRPDLVSIVAESLGVV